eukprot:NODE_8312_length_1505_cov_20.185051.p2 GENE.NODE_8312_length_1505_cov_20.185051~~NODE_8312_length_1505_cov_20.185051.p2  ORF type:complete len:347 (-),score=100.44 NODE_8312_length_1505_cov_20.185051:338-1378(-)
MKKKTSIKQETATSMSPDEQRRATHRRISSVIEGPIAEKVPKKAQPYVRKLAPIIAHMVVGLIVAWPYILKGVGIVHKYAEKIPANIAQGIIGFFMCCFGGVFPAIIAAVEAWRLCGGHEALMNVTTIGQQLTKIEEASKKDDKVDADGDGIADVNQITGSQLLQRKTLLAMSTINPEELNGALAGLFQGWVGVIATLKVQFARTVTLGTSIGEMLNKPCHDIIAPMVKPLMSEEHQKWVPVILQWACKVVGITIAWWIQRVLSAVHSAIRGGKMLGAQLINEANRRGIISFSDKDTQIDEMIGWGLALLGFLIQLSYGFRLPLLFRIFLFPLEILEGYIVWEVMT